MSLGVCKPNSYFKSFMDYKKISDKKSKQYKLIQNALIKRKDGLLVDKDGFIAVALSSRYGDIGDRFIIELSSGNEVKVIKADEKADRDVIYKCYHPDGSVVELIIDTKKASVAYKEAILMGDFNYSNFFNGKIVDIRKVINKKGK